MPDVSFNSAVAAYKAAARTAGDVVPHAQGQATQTGETSSFASMVKDVVQTSMQTLEQGERMSLKGIAGTADTRDVVMAVNNAELTLQTVVAVRDKVVSAYDTIMRMPL
ncbi:flagellar hook-basal body complex protein FliE [Roseospira goensis]|uniref:Flagellar hook-basal body complex protein FliE n=1 Tax=Roseospira goensis TaxID=391922 RepID=A0A7W6S0J5_9PROT|nr:flagellar hook-basal body complex protein FliE [Roseospira goensis]MBB4286150.1 flagellar hook-basal body complex protein FliE [Roseospira goensis]